MKRIALAIALLVATTASAAMPIELDATTPDTAGSRLAYAIKERLRKSSSMEQTFVQSKTRLKLSLITLEKDRQYPGIGTVYSAVILFSVPGQMDAMLTHYVGYCGSERLTDCADSIVAGIDEQLDVLKKVAPTLTKF